jgi:hypothetical protein
MKAGPRDKMLKNLRTMASGVINGIVQDVPPALFACEVCGALDCSNQEWINCRNRLAAAEFLKSGDRPALAELKRLQVDRDRALCPSLPACAKTEKAL